MNVADPVSLARRITAALREMRDIIEEASPAEQDAVRRVRALVQTWSIHARTPKN